MKLSYTTLALIKNWMKGFIPTWANAKNPESLVCAAMAVKLVKRLAAKTEMMEDTSCKISFNAAECSVIYKAWLESPFTMGQAPSDMRALIEQIHKTYFV
jgi:hypothetical protein